MACLESAMIDNPPENLDSPECQLASDGTDQQADFKGLCNDLETEIRSHARLISGYGYSTHEGMEDLQHGLQNLLEMILENDIHNDTTDSPSHDLIARRFSHLISLSRTIERDVVASAKSSERLCKRMIQQLRESDVGNRRSAMRTPFNLECKLAFGSERIACRTDDVSLGGAKLNFTGCKAHNISINQSAKLEVEGIGTIAVDVVALAGMSCHVAFQHLAPDVRNSIEAIAGTIRDYLDATTSRIIDLVEATPQPRHADWLFSRLNQETVGLKGIRVRDSLGAPLSDYAIDVSILGENWPEQTVPEASLSAIELGSANVAANPMLMTIDVNHPQISAVELVFDAAFALRHGQIETLSRLASQIH